VLPAPPFKVAQKSGQKGGDNSNVRELYLPMKHSDHLPCSDAFVEPKYQRTWDPQHPPFEGFGKSLLKS
jgi:hypothetical protein